jgi:hypothetical protein
LAVISAFVLAASIACSRGAPPARPAKVAVDCVALAEVRSHRSFHFQFANEWHTGHLRVVGCLRDMDALRQVAESSVIDWLQTVAEARPLEIPSCRVGSQHSELLAEINGRAGRSLATQACADVVADI